jgi:hypothetical protein
MDTPGRALCAHAAKLTLLAACLPVVASARPSPPQTAASDSWARPAAAGPARYAGAPRPGAAGGAERFKFKDGRPALPPPSAPDPFGKAPVSGGVPRIGPDGRPALDCMQSPMDPRCR